MSTFKWCFDVFNGRSRGLECQEGCRGRHPLHFICMGSWNQKNWGSLQAQFRFRFKNKSQVNFETGGSKHARLSSGHFSLLNSSSVSSPSKDLVQSKTSMSRMLQQKPSLIGFSIQHPHQFFPRKSRLPMMLPNWRSPNQVPILLILAGSIALQRPTAEVAEPLVVTNVYIVFAPWIWIYQFLAACAICLFICPFRSSSTFAVWLYASGHEITRLGWHTSSPAQGFATAWWPCLFWCISEHHGQCVDGYGSGAWRAMRITTFWAGYDFKMNVSGDQRLDMSRFRCVFICLCLKHSALLC